jgi:hypothetical protein
LQEGTPWFIKQEMAKHPRSFPHAGLPCSNLTNPYEHGYSPKVTFPTLNIQQIQDYASAYFNTFNSLHPILDQDKFMDDIVAALPQAGYVDGEPDSIIALLVFALGQLAIEGVFGEPVSAPNGVASGFRGGDLEKPPGLEIFNEARRRLGFIVSLSTLENVQILLLQATYYEANAHHLEFWKSTVAASMTIQVLIRCQNFKWSSHTGGMISRAYWTCLFNEHLYHLDLDLPQSGIDSLEDEVPLPYFYADQDPHGRASNLNEEQSHFQYHFVAMSALRRLIVRIHGIIHVCALCVFE